MLASRATVQLDPALVRRRGHLRRRTIFFWVAADLMAMRQSVVSVLFGTTNSQRFCPAVVEAHESSVLVVAFKGCGCI